MRKVTLNSEDCIGCETCVKLCPDTFYFDPEAGDIGKACVKEVTGDDEECIEEAITSCPVDCIQWE